MQKEKRTKSAETTQQIELEPDYSQCLFFKPPAFFWLIIPLGSKAIFSRKCDNKPEEKKRVKVRPYIDDSQNNCQKL